VSAAANRSECLAWNGETGERWIADAERRDRVLRPVSEVLLRAGRLQPGEAVLDVGCGCGALALDASRAVGRSGSVLGVDISDTMLSVALQRIAEPGFGNISLLQADAQTHAFEPACHDVAISRFGTMFFDDPRAAFDNIASALVPGGRLCIATWQPLVANEWLMVPGAALLEFGSLPSSGDDGVPGMFAQSDPTTITAALHGSGFTDVTVEAATVPMRLGADADEAADYLADTGMGRTVLDPLAPHQQQAALDAVRDALRDHQTPDGVILGGGILVTSAGSRSRPR